MMKKLIAVFILIAFSSCKMSKIDGVFVNSNLKYRAPLFFSFKNDSLFLKNHKAEEFIGLRLSYKNNKIVAVNDSCFFNDEKLSLKFEITQSNFSLDIIDVSVNPLFNETINATPIKTNYQNKTSIAGYWLSTYSDFEKAYFYINDKFEVVTVSLYNDELIYFSERGKIIYGKINQINSETYLDIFVNTDYLETYLLDKIDDERIQLFYTESRTNNKNYFHLTKVNFSMLPRELKDEVIKKEMDTTRFDSESRKGLEIISSDFEEIEEIEEFDILDKKTK
ncbi:MAG: hypothetical protein PSN34_03700 [Urechidicola sp.]|nr:hypothetical protein [Urechidicola sp.]